MLHGKLIREHLGPNADPKHSSSDLETLLSDEGEIATLHSVCNNGLGYYLKKYCQ